MYCKVCVRVCALHMNECIDPLLCDHQRRPEQDIWCLLQPFVALLQ